jgi:hypothetical protein
MFPFKRKNLRNFPHYQIHRKVHLNKNYIVRFKILQNETINVFSS